MMTEVQLQSPVSKNCTRCQIDGWTGSGVGGPPSSTPPRLLSDQPVGGNVRLCSLTSRKPERHERAPNPPTRLTGVTQHQHPLPTRKRVASIEESIESTCCRLVCLSVVSGGGVATQEKIHACKCDSSHADLHRFTWTLTNTYVPAASVLVWRALACARPGGRHCLAAIRTSWLQPELERPSRPSHVFHFRTLRSENSSAVSYKDRRDVTVKRNFK